MSNEITVRPIEQSDEETWRKHWAAYNEFYNRTDTITEKITSTTFSRFLSKDSVIQCAVAVAEDNIVGFVTWYPHANTASVEEIIYLNDLFVDPTSRNGGVGRKLIEQVYSVADEKGMGVYWHTQVCWIDQSTYARFTEKNHSTSTTAHSCCTQRWRRGQTSSCMPGSNVEDRDRTSVLPHTCNRATYLLTLRCPNVHAHSIFIA